MPEIACILPHAGQDCCSASARHLELEGCRMQHDESFPLEAIPPRVRRAIVREFQGRRPTVGEVARISDRQWLATPDIGPTALETIHGILHARPARDGNCLPRLVDVELLDRLEAIQKELRRMRRTLEARLGAASGTGSRRRDRAGSLPQVEASPR
jgi:hypothetical protein